MSEKNLVIVESPAKAKTIEKYLGKDYSVTSSMGHVRDLPKDDISIDINKGFKPTYEISEDKKELVNKLKKLSKDAQTVWLATDADREGEAIAWHLLEALKLQAKDTKRIVFREITKSAIQTAILHPREIDIDLVNAQQARRILDRLVGYELSPVLWKKIRKGLSAGRVQSVAVRLVVEREREIEAFSTKYSYKVTAKFDLGNGKILDAELQKNLESEEEILAFLEKCKNAEFSLKNLEKKPVKKSPAPPFTTSTLQQEASARLGFSVAQTMLVAQKLYESGKISYMRTDSTNLSDEAIHNASNEITTSFGDEFLKVRKYETKSENAQEAHEAIRPTNFSDRKIHGNLNEQKLYELIWKRAIASQMADAQLERTIATINISTLPQNLVATGEVIIFEGYLKIYIDSKNEDDTEEENTKLLPPMTVGQILDLSLMKATQKFTNPPPRFSEASLVRKLEELGIGRPSTYAPTISTIQKREYIVKESREGKIRKFDEFSLKNNFITRNVLESKVGTEKNKLYPTSTAMLVNDFLVENFPTVVDFSFTATIEKEFDEIASGKLKWVKMLEEFYGGFHERVEHTESQKKKTGEGTRELGKDPTTGKKIYAKFGKFGPYIQIGENDDVPKPKFASLKKSQLLESITLAEALELFKLPRDVGKFENKEMVVSIGRFGPYIRHDSKFYSLLKSDDPYTITEERAVEIIISKRSSDSQKTIKIFTENPELKVLKGRFGPYIALGKENYKIPKTIAPESITYEQCLELTSAPKESKPKFKKKS